jgi:hypothetical protein
MGARLLEIYENAGKLFGFDGRMKLALLKALPSARAETEADTPELIKKFDLAFAQLKQTKKS